MNHQEAKEILRLYRPGTADVQDPAFVPAREMALQDSNLAQWFENHRANYANIRSQFKQITIPPGLKGQILAEYDPASAVVTGALTNRQSEESDAVPQPTRKNSPPFDNGMHPQIQSNIIRKYTGWWRKPVFLQAAAVFVLLLGLAIFWLRQPNNNDYSQYRVRMVSTALRTYGMDLETSDLNQIQSFLAEKKAPSGYPLPEGLKKLEATGCVVIHWQGNPVSMICFRTGRPLRPGEKSDLFLFVADRTAFPNAGSKNSTSMEQVNRLMTASWTQDDKIFLLAAPGDAEFLRKLL